MRRINLGLIVFALLEISGCSHTDEVTPRSYVQLAYGYTSTARHQIADALKARPNEPVPIAGTFQLTPPNGLAPLKTDFGWISQGGVIVIRSEQYAVLVIFEPKVRGADVRWSCVVYPADATPTTCGDA
jgi:hypothetical protein